jgi:NitT/TauT family transport system substrate-binding protein
LQLLSWLIAIALSSFIYFGLNSVSNEKENLSLGGFSVNSETFSLIYIAQTQHYFSDNGINLTINSNFAGGVNTLNAALNNKIDLAASSDFAFVSNAAIQQKNLTIIASIDKAQSVYLIARKDKGIETPANLNGKNVGLTLNAAGEFYFGRFLELNGLSIHNVNLTNLQPSQYIQAITNGTVDAVVVTKTIANQIQTQLPNNTIIWSVQSDQLAYVLISCSNDWTIQHPNTIVRFLKALSQAQVYLTNNRASGEAIVEKQLNTTISRETWSDNQIGLSLDQSLVVAMQDEAQWLINNNLTNATDVPNLINYIYLDGLNSVKPGAVNIID